ncbi:MAG: TniQ family protein [Gammaproteobacteria bacterium]|nr:TniQ family protein [Gammaproteobacteria bacterium]MBU1506826.1 TniQ family protein [Gammaproteobacteria bacterium]MBU2121973.1 TniQ family protein [Gammaproteobacteria bacterium]MBU2202291.1 TniQ family protein [Gammaproteobacteria bacterium]MBU2277127.1 TniQ family protein [Gammaproteobacteria bacterium]
MSNANDSPCLFASPPPLPSESPFSWIQRICGAHQYTLTSLTKTLKAWPPGGEWDSQDASTALKQVSRSSGYEAVACGEALFGFAKVEKAYRDHSFLSMERRDPIYKWCAQCLASDSTPYLRWEWRLEDHLYCHVHRTALQDRCCWCQHPLSVGRTVLVGRGCSDLTICSECGMSLVDPGPLEIEEPSSGRFDPTDPMLHVVSSLKLEFARDSDQMHLQFDPPPPSAPPRSSYHPQLHLQASTSTEKSQPPLLINAATFGQEACGSSLRVKTPLSPDLARYKDIRLATLLRVIRNDRNLNPTHYEAQDAKAHAAR